MQFSLTCALGLESVARKEIERLGIAVDSVTDRLVRFSGSWKDLAAVHLWSRVGSRAWVELASGPCGSFDEAFALVSGVDWKSWVPADWPVLVTATSVRSLVAGESALQSVGKKAVMSRVSGGAYGLVREDPNLPCLHVELLLVADVLRVMVDATGPDALHKRGYRALAGEAPLKESLAAGLVQLAGWDFREPFYDPFCGSGTIAIEAALYAARRAPGLARGFAFEKWPSFPQEEAVRARDEARAAAITDKAYAINASDADPAAIRLAQGAALKAGVDHLITFEMRAFVAAETRTGALVCNPPYGLRMGAGTDLAPLYRDLSAAFTAGKLDGGVLTAWEGAADVFTGWKGRKFRVGGQDARFWQPRRG